MPDDHDDQPHTSKNPFIRFKNHVNARIGTGISAFTGVNTRCEDTATTPRSEDPYGRPFCANREMHPFDRPRRRREPTEGFQYWDKWAQLDPYSPYNLRHLPQPIPNDLPRDVDAGHFGYHEAFEDLMTVSGIDDGPLMDLRGRADLKKTILRTFASGEPSLVWVRRLHGRGLLPPPFIWEHSTFLDEVRAYSEQAVEQEQDQGHHRPASMREWLDERRKTIEQTGDSERKHADDIETLQGLADKMLKEFGGKGMSWDDMMTRLDKDVTFNLAEMIRKADQAVRGLERGIERYSGELASRNIQTRTVSAAKPAPDDQHEQPDTEQDLFSIISSAFAEADRSFNSFAKSITGMASPPADWQAEPGRTEKLPGGETVEYDSFGGKTVTTTSEHTDTLGNIHSQTEVRRLNADGEEVGRQTHYSVYSSHSTDTSQPASRQEDHSSWSEPSGESVEQHRRENVKSVNKNGNSSGWFWR